MSHYFHQTFAKTIWNLDGVIFNHRLWSILQSSSILQLFRPVDCSALLLDKILFQRLEPGFLSAIVMKCLIIIINRYLLSQCRSLSELVLKWALRDFLPKFRKVLVTGSSTFRLGNYRLSDRKLHRWKR